MNTRIYLSINLIVIAFVLVFLPENENKKGEIKPIEQVQLLLKDNQEIGVDLAARYVAAQNTDFQFIDLRSRGEYLAFNIPSSINIPYEQLFDKKWQGYLNQTDKTNILYGNGDFKSNLAVAILNNKGYNYNKILIGGLNEWFAIVMRADFKGGRLTARENALYETRRKAKNLFIEINSLPDSLKNTFLEARILEEEQLDGGCE